MFDAAALRHDFSRAAPRYDAQAQLQLQVRRQVLALAQRYWPNGARILDAGCGTGALAEEAPPWHIVGLDMSPGMCALARARSVRVINAAAEAMPFAPAYFDGVFSSLMLQWSNDPAQALKEIARVLKPGGQAVIATLAEGSLQELRTAFAKIDTESHVSDFLMIQTLLALAQQAKLTVLSATQKAVVEHYADAAALMRSLKAIGATNKQQLRRRSLLTPSQLARVAQEYRQRFGNARGVPATWQVAYLVLEK